MKAKTVEELIQESHRLAEEINRLEQTGDYSKTIAIKKRYHEVKLEAISLIQFNENRPGITAKQLIQTVNDMPKQPKYAIGITPIDRELATWEDKQYGNLGGIETGTFINLAGESGAGKTTLTIDILANVSQYSRTVFFNHEMGLRRMASRLSKRLTTDAQKENMIIDSSTDGIDDIVNEITIYAHEGVKFFVIDSRMKIRVEGDSEVQRNANISAKLSKLARSKEIIIILINQMSEADIKDKRLALKGGGDQKYDSDMVWFYIKDDKDNSKRKLVCTKNRTGDENLWSAELAMKDGITVGASEAVQIFYESKSASMPFIGD